MATISDEQIAVVQNESPVLERVNTYRQPRLHGWRVLLKDAGRLPKLESYGTLVARVFISQIFLFSGLMKIIDWSSTEAQMTGRGMFWVPLFHILAIVTEIGAGCGVLLGFKSRLAALILFGYMFVVTVVFHDFWSVTDPPLRQWELAICMQNLTLMGGLLLIAAHGPGLRSLGHPKRKHSLARARLPRKPR